MADSGGYGKRQIRIAEGQQRMKPPFIQPSECSRQYNLIPSSFMTPDSSAFSKFSISITSMVRKKLLTKCHDHGFAVKFHAYK
ncbi:uncharacterized protein LOC117097582 [Trachypithecus francoisi]|uniref:uncharacterized protein LOC117097582 n=1 Tax=Trachypithecus francoisi TaxID=54180 RepID=UPI00141AFD39|nr:uncharacterized protein LOC117097582 [Trachypithecus francoisi]